jgi:hypothetical protein
MPPVVLSAAAEGTDIFICYMILLTTMVVSIIIIWMTDSDDDNALPQDERVPRGCITCFSGAVLLACVMFLFILGI